MNYKVGDKVRVHSLHWFRVNCHKKVDGNYIMPTYGRIFTKAMFKLCGHIVTITEIGHDFYRIKEDGYFWDDDMFKESINYYVGDKVRVHTKAWFEKNCLKYDNIIGYRFANGTNTFNSEMEIFCGQEVTIKHIDSINNYEILEDSGLWTWEGWMFEVPEQNNNNRIGNSNIIADLCKSLGISVGQIIVSNDGGYKYRLTETYGLEVFGDGDWKVCGSYSFNTFITMLQEYKFVTKWIPKDNERVYYVDFYNENLYNYMFYNPENEHFKNLLDCNMLYRTEQEAVEAAKRYMNQMKGEN